MSHESYEQMGLFEATYEPYIINKKIRLIELFAGIGAQSKALELLGADFEGWRTCEWSVHSIIAYNAIHVGDWSDHSEGLTKEDLIERVRGVSANYNEPMSDRQLASKGEAWLRRLYSSMVAIKDLKPDVSALHAEDLGITERERYEYVMTYSFPCQDLSLAGKMKGMRKGESTRSGMLWQVERLLLELKARDELPQVLIMENVPQVHSGDNIGPFNDWLDSLQAMGYSSYYKDLNAKRYGIPQNRNRCFMVSILGEASYTFPDPIRLRKRLRDFLDKGPIDEKYYLTDEVISRITFSDEEKPGR